MTRYNDGTRYNSGAVYGPVVAVQRHMAKIKINVANLRLASKISKGAELVSMGTDNPNVPGNSAAIAALASAQADLQAAEEAAQEARNIAKQRTAERDAALEAWMQAVSNLASFTQSATGGDAGKILSAGFDICNPPVPLPVPGLVTGVTIALTNEPGHSKITWNEVAGAEGFMIQGSPDPITPTSWTTPTVSLKTRIDANGASPGEKYWYRLAAFNSAGQGPWCEPVQRPVM